VAKWTFRFGKSEDLRKFIDDVEDAMQLHDVSNRELLRGISALLTEPAKTWFRRNKTKITSWRLFKRLIKEAFTPDDNDEETIEKINCLKQKPDETYAVYEARMLELADRLSEPMSEKEKIRKMMKGLDLFYRSRIRQSEIHSLTNLRRECRELETDKAQIVRLEREKHKSREKPRTDYKRENRDERRPFKSATAYEADVANSSDSSEEGTTAVNPESAATQLTPGKAALQCWRCGGAGHFANDCTEAIFCTICGMPDTVMWRCRNCAKARAASLWRGASASS
jgi:hypothetical protein